MGRRKGVKIIKGTVPFYFYLVQLARNSINNFRSAILFLLVLHIFESTLPRETDVAVGHWWLVRIPPLAMTYIPTLVASLLANPHCWWESLALEHERNITRDYKNCYKNYFLQRIFHEWKRFQKLFFLDIARLKFKLLR